MNLRPIATEKAIMKVEIENILTFSIDQKTTKQEFKKRAKVFAEPLDIDHAIKEAKKEIRQEKKRR